MQEKSPAYQWYPKDILTEKRVIRMSLETEAIYRRLLDYSWLEDGLDNDMALLASYAKMPGQMPKFLEHWKQIKSCFFRDGKKWRNPRQEKERKKQKIFSEKQRNNAKRRWNKEDTKDAVAHATALPRHASGNALHLQSSSSFPSSKDDRSIFNTFTEKQIQDIRIEIAKACDHALLSEANEAHFKDFKTRMERYFYKKKVRDPYAYALESAKKLNQKQPATTA